MPISSGRPKQQKVPNFQLEIKNLYRFVFMAFAGFSLVGATETWHSMGYLSPVAWAFEWLDVILAFLCVYAATRYKDIGNKMVVYLLIIMSFLAAILPLRAAITLPIFVTPNPAYYYIFIIPILFLVFFVLFHKRVGQYQKYASVLFFFILITTVMFITFLFYSYSLRFPTDESVVDLYSAHLFLNGMNPYNLSNIASAFGFYNYPQYANTPLTTGGYVYYLTYPALSFLTLIPAALFGIKSSLIMYPLFAIPIFLAWYRGYSRKEFLGSVLVLVPFLSLSIYTSQVEFADLNIMWAVLVMISYYVLPRAKLSGFVYGLALSVKQFPVIALPFLLYFIYREYGKVQSLKWFFFVIIAFALINGYFMVIGFHEFFKSMIANEIAPLIGVGFGISQLSFLGFLDIPPVFFSTIIAGATIFLFYLYIRRYQDLRYALFAFPVIIFLFNYRLFVQYILYWMILSLIPFMDLLHYKEVNDSIESDNSIPKRSNFKDRRKVKAIAIIFFIILTGTVSGGIYQGVVKNPGSFTVNSVTMANYNATGFVDQVSANLTFNGNAVSESPVYFRFILPEPIGNLNMYLWRPASNVTLQSGQSITMNFVPLYSVYLLPPGKPYRLVAYYGSAMGSFTGTT